MHLMLNQLLRRLGKSNTLPFSLEVNHDHSLLMVLEQFPIFITRSIIWQEKWNNPHTVKENAWKGKIANLFFMSFSRPSLWLLSSSRLINEFFSVFFSELLFKLMMFFYVDDNKWKWGHAHKRCVFLWILALRYFRLWFPELNQGRYIQKSLF